MLRGAIGIAAFLVLAEIAGRLGLISDALPLTSEIVARAVTLMPDADFLPAVGQTLKTSAIGLLVTGIVMIPLGVILGTFPKAERALRPFIEFMRPVPSIALIPLAILVFRDVFAAEVAIVIYAATWPILLNTMYAVRDVDPVARETMRSFGFGPAAVLRFVSLPSAAPFILTGIRLSAAIAIIVAISTELFAVGVSGIGVFLITAQSGGGAVETVIAAAVWSGVIGLAINGLFVYAGRRLFRWHHARGGETT
jgi:ABC-type nitrate/sulfonate/bicarbonate transport system, permease component